MKVVIHCGAPKTGSTSLQYFLHDHEEFLNAEGVFYPARLVRRGEVDSLHSALTEMVSAGPLPALVRKARERLQEIEGTPGVRSLFLSNEMLLGDPVRFPQAGFFPRRGVAVDTLKAVFTGYDVRIKYVIRDYSDFIQSWYVQYVRRGGACSLKQFSAVFDLGQQGWCDVIDALREAFGSENVRGCSFDVVRRAPDSFLAMMLGDITSSLPPGTSLASYRMNESVGRAAVAIARRVNAVLVAGLGMNPRRAGDLTRNTVLRNLSRIFPSAKPKLDAELAHQLDLKYRQDLMALNSSGVLEEA